MNVVYEYSLLNNNSLDQWHINYVTLFRCDALFMPSTRTAYFNRNRYINNGVIDQCIRWYGLIMNQTYEIHGCKCKSYACLVKAMLVHEHVEKLNRSSPVDVCLLDC